MMEKKEMRKYFRSLRAMISEETLDENERKCFQIYQENELYLLGQTFFVYLSVGREASTKRIISDLLKRDKLVFVPLLKDGEMLIVPYEEDMKLVQTMGVMQPEREEGAVAPSAVDVAILPCVAVDKSFGRLGMGGGFYDRFLTEFDGISIALAHEFQLCENVNMEAHDRRVDAILTELRFISKKEGL